jgi:uncharacterized protein
VLHKAPVTHQVPCRIAASVLLVTVVALGGCGREQTPHPPLMPSTIRIVTGPPGLTFEPLGEALAAAYARKLPDLRFEALSTPGTETNLHRLQAGDAELAFSVANIAYAAYGGLDAQFRPAASNLRTMAVLHPSSVHILVPRTSTARSLSDLRGRVAVGPEGSGLTAKTLIQQFALPDRIVVDQTLSLSDAADALAAGQIEGAIIVAADPVDVVERAVAKGARVIPIPKQDLQRLRADYPFLRPGAIPAATYAGVPQPVATLLVDVLLVTRADLDDELVRQLTSALFEILPDLAGRFPYLGLMNMQRAPASPIPLHPGAALFYRERELSR